MGKIRKQSWRYDLCGVISKITAAVPLFIWIFARDVNAAPVSMDVISTLSYIQALLTHLGPTLSAVLFIVAGVFYALGQIFPAHKRAEFHSMAVDIIIGAIIVAVLSIASTSLAVASTQLITNISSNSL